MKKATFLRNIFLIATLGVLILPFRSAQAHAGGEPLLINAQAGPFFISVWALPKPLVTGETNFVVFVAEDLGDDSQRANSPILNADVELRLQISDQSAPPIVIPATHRLNNKLFYESYFDLLDAGNHTGRVSVNFNGQSGAAEFDFMVNRPPVVINWFLYSTLAATIITAGWFLTMFAEE